MNIRCIKVMRASSDMSIPVDSVVAATDLGYVVVFMSGEACREANGDVVIRAERG